MTKRILLYPLDDVLDVVTRRMTEHCTANNQSVKFSTHLLDRGVVMLRAAMTDIETDAQWFFRNEPAFAAASRA